MTIRQNNMFLCSFVLLTVIATVHSKSFFSPVNQAKEYLEKYGYLFNSTDASTHEILTGLVHNGQKLFSLPDLLKNRTKRSAPQGRKEISMTYKIEQYPKNLKKEDVDAEFAKAFDVWSKSLNIKFTQKTSGPVTFTIKFAKIKNGDGHVLAYIDGHNIYFNGDELWTIENKSPKIFPVAVDEIGLALISYFLKLINY